ncbi:hypothetical protein [Nocardioides sp.]|uniref:hypothetical protein n=1 Tax=Nocardioides sp. TaxID=35761 RepID=UPI001A268E29|nr:hypothetical protein [Nocardioides sp.]MBJ7358064.1 hypothetical protein [Nocardioides sp.]
MTALLVLALFVGLVLALSATTRRTRASALGCCAPADPRSDLRMRAAFHAEGADEGAAEG